MNIICPILHILEWITTIHVYRHTQTQTTIIPPTAFIALLETKHQTTDYHV